MVCKYNHGTPCIESVLNNNRPQSRIWTPRNTERSGNPMVSPKSKNGGFPTSMFAFMPVPQSIIGQIIRWKIWKKARCVRPNLMFDHHGVD